MNLMQPPILTHLVWMCFWRVLVSCGQTKLCPDCVRYVCCYIFVGWVYFRVINDPLQYLSVKMGGGHIFRGGRIFERLRYK